MKKGRCVNGERLKLTLKEERLKDELYVLEYAVFIGEDWGVYIKGGGSS
jgi:hypothetical protein